MAAPHPTPKLNSGNKAEALAEQFLAGRGLKTVLRNYRCRGGEIDLIMREGATLVFVEVRLRTHGGFGSATESVAARKQQRIVLAAQHYLSTLGTTPACRFDVVGMEALDTKRIDWIRDAFSA